MQVLDEVCDVFEAISGTKSRKEKERLLHELAAAPHLNDLAVPLLSNALDWYIHFGIATLPEATGTTTSNVAAGTFFALLAELQQRSTRDHEYILGILNRYPPNTAKWLRRVLLKDLKMGAEATTVNKVWPGLINTFECQLANTLDAVDALRYPVLIEPKIDGVRAIFISDGRGGLKCLSRGGNILYNVGPIAHELNLVLGNRIFEGRPQVFDGELFVNTLHKSLSIVRSQKPIDIRAEGLKYNLFDVIDEAEWRQQHASVSQHARSTLVAKIAQHSLEFVVPTISSVEDRLANNASELESFYVRDLEAGHEGSMVKDLHSTYKFGRSSGWLKYKPFEVDVFEVTGYDEGSGRHEGRLGALQVKVADGITTSVGGGFSDAQRDSLWAAGTNLLTRKAKVKYKQKTPDGLLREPVFLSFVE